MKRIISNNAILAVCILCAIIFSFVLTFLVNVIPELTLMSEKPISYVPVDITTKKADGETVHIMYDEPFLLKVIYAIKRINPFIAPVEFIVFIIVTSIPFILLKNLADMNDILEYQKQRKNQK